MCTGGTLSEGVSATKDSRFKGAIVDMFSFLTIGKIKLMEMI